MFNWLLPRNYRIDYMGDNTYVVRHLEIISTPIGIRTNYIQVGEPQSSLLSSHNMITKHKHDKKLKSVVKTIFIK